jgi:hypothetical protein
VLNSNRHVEASLLAFLRASLAHLLQLLVQITRLLRQLNVAEAHTTTSLINQINGLVRQEAARKGAKEGGGVVVRDACTCTSHARRG